MLAASGHTTDRDAQTRRPSWLAPDLTHAVIAMKFSPDGRLLAIARGARDDYRIDIWDTETGTLQRTIRGFDGPVSSVSFSPDGRTLLTGSTGVHRDQLVNERRIARSPRFFTELKWWDSQTGEFKQRFEIPEEELSAIMVVAGPLSVTATYSPDGKFLAAIDHRYEVMLMYETRPQADSTRIRPPDPGRRSSNPGSPTTLNTLERAMDGSSKYKSAVKLLDAGTGKTILKLKDGFSSKETSMFSGSLITDVPSLTVARRVATVSPDGKVVAAWNASEIRVWASGSGEALLKLNKIKGQVRGVAFSPDGSSLAAAITMSSRTNDQISFQSEIRVWKIATGAEQKVIRLRTPVVNGATFAPNGGQLLVAGLQVREGGTYPSMELVDLQSGSAGSITSRDEGIFSTIETTPDGELMAFQTGISTVKLVDTRGWRVRYTFEANAESTSSSRSFSRGLVSVKNVPAVTFLPDGNTVVGELESGGVRVWDARTGEVKKAFAQNADTGSIAEISSDGSVLAEISGDEIVRVWNVRTGAHVEIPFTKGPPVAVAVSGNGKVLAVAYANEIGLFNLDDPKVQPIGAPIQGHVDYLTLSLDGKLLAGSTAQGDVQIWSREDGKLQKHFPTGFGVSALRFTPQADVLAIGSKGGRLSLWNLQTGAMVFESKKHSAMVGAIAFSADGRLMATGSDDRTAIIWEVGSGNARHTLRDHDFTATSLAFSPGADLLAVGSGNASVVLWDVATGKLNRVMR